MNNNGYILQFSCEKKTAGNKVDAPISLPYTLLGEVFVGRNFRSQGESRKFFISQGFLFTDQLIFDFLWGFNFTDVSIFNLLSDEFMNNNNCFFCFFLWYQTCKMTLNYLYKLSKGLAHAL